MSSILASIFPSVVAAVGGDQLFVENGLRSQTIDLEATRDLRLSNTEITSHLGIRHVNLDQRRRAIVTGVFPQAMDFEREFKGFGLSLGADTRTPLGSTGMALILDAGGSMVHGKKSVARTLSGVYPPLLPPPLPSPPVVTLDGAKETTLVAEIAIGLELRRRCGRCDVAVNVLYESRVWTGPSTPVLGIIGFDGFSAGIEAIF